jgi:hypothetical protein
MTILLYVAIHRSKGSISFMLIAGGQAHLALSAKMRFESFFMPMTAIHCSSVRRRALGKRAGLGVG